MSRVSRRTLLAAGAGAAAIALPLGAASASESHASDSEPIDPPPSFLPNFPYLDVPKGGYERVPLS